MRVQIDKAGIMRPAMGVGGRGQGLTLEVETFDLDGLRGRSGRVRVRATGVSPRVADQWQFANTPATMATRLTRQQGREGETGSGALRYDGSIQVPYMTDGRQQAWFQGCGV